MEFSEYKALKDKAHYLVNKAVANGQLLDLKIVNIECADCAECAG